MRRRFSDLERLVRVLVPVVEVCGLVNDQKLCSGLLRFSDDIRGREHRDGDLCHLRVRGAGFYRVAGLLESAALSEVEESCPLSVVLSFWDSFRLFLYFAGSCVNLFIFMLVRRFVPVSELGRGAALFTAEIAQEAPHTAETRLHGGDLYSRVLIIQQDARRLVYPQTETHSLMLIPITSRNSEESRCWFTIRALAIPATVSSSRKFEVIYSIAPTT